MLAQAITGIAKCPALESLTISSAGEIDIDKTGARPIDFAPLHTLSRLRYLNTTVLRISAIEFKCIRRMPSLVEFHSCSRSIFSSEALCDILKEPSNQRLQTLSASCFCLDDAAGAALGSLTSLKKLDLFVRRHDTLTHIAWVQSFSELSSLVIQNSSLDKQLTPDNVCSGLAMIPHLRRLELKDCGLTTQHFVRLPVMLPYLERLCLDSVPDASMFQALGALHSTLQDLELIMSCRFKSTDIDPLHVLVRLKRLILCGTPYELERRDSRYKPPSALMPSLEYGNVSY
jgi:hypothetical protein